jgi:DNA-directed RNA polymerase specialized sigma24 family protein
MHHQKECRLANLEDEIREAFEAVVNNDQGTYEQWLCIAQSLLRSYELTDEYKAEDVLAELYLKLATGKRTWNREKFPELEKYFFVLIISHIKNLANEKKRKRRKEVKIEHLNTDELKFLCAGDRRITYEEIKELVDLYAPKFQGDAQLEKILWKIMNEDTNKEIAGDLNIEVRSVVNAKRRIQRIFDPLLKTHHKRRDHNGDRQERCSADS